MAHQQNSAFAAEASSANKVEASPLLRVENLHIQFPTIRGRVHAVQGVSFTVQQGEILGLVGETGCGKTMTGLSILRLVPPPGQITAGEIHFDGYNLLTKSQPEMRAIRGRQIAMIFQDPSTSLNPVFTIGNQIGRVISHHLKCSRGERERRVLDLLADVGLPEPEQIARSYSHQLSGGMQQRAVIAMALAAEPRLLIADEPTTALDVTIQAQILELLVELQSKRGISIILIAHNLGVVAEICQRVAVLYAGRVAEIASANALFECPQHPYTQKLLQALPTPERGGQVLQSIPGEVPSGLNPEAGCSFAPRCAYVIDRCRRERPPQYAATPAHQVACYLCEDGVWHDCEIP